jgi:hypothetical protein
LPPSSSPHLCFCSQQQTSEVAKVVGNH